MDTLLNQIQESLEFELSSTFLSFWEDHNPSTRKHIPTFSVQKKELGGDWGRRIVVGSTPIQWIIVIASETPPNVQEISLAHEILHIVLDCEGYPVIEGKEGARMDEIGANLHSVLLHPIIWARLRSYGFSIDEHINRKAEGQLNDLRGRQTHPSRSQSPEWELWVLLYMLARLEWSEEKSEQIYLFFNKLGSSIGRQGESNLKRLYSLGYPNQQSLTPSVVSQAGELLLQRLKLDGVMKLNYIQPLR